MYLLGNNISTVEQASSHILSGARVTLNHLVVGLEAIHSDLLHGVGLVRSLGGGNYGSVSNKREMDTGIGNQVGLELSQVDIERTIEAERCSDRGDDYLAIMVSICTDSHFHQGPV